MKNAIQFFIIFTFLTFVLIFPNDVSGIETYSDKEKLSKYVNYDPIGFSLEYPKYLELRKNILDSEGWILSLNDTKDLKISLDVFVLSLDPELKHALEKDIIDYMFLLNFYACDKATISQTGYKCFNFSPLDYEVRYQNNAEYYAITYSILTKDKAGNYADKTKTVTDIWIPNESYFISIHGTFRPSQYLDSIGVYDGIVESVDLRIQSMKTPSIPIELKIKGALWSQDLITDQEFFEYLIQIIEKDTKIHDITTKTHLPDWLKNTNRWWIDGLISDIEYYNSINYLYERGIIWG